MHYNAFDLFLAASQDKESKEETTPAERDDNSSDYHEAKGRMGYWLRGCEGKRNNCFSKIQLEGDRNIETKHLALVIARL